jgi:tetratricopeptide (TPR) repeat protein
MRRIGCVAAFLAILFIPFWPLSTLSRADAGPSATVPPDQLGKVHFPTSCAAGVQGTIEKGVALLHSFQYQESEQTFTDAASRDSKCAMAHWGIAMAHFEQLWDFPSDKTLKQGRSEIEKARKMNPSTNFEKGFLDAAAAFYQKKKMTHAERGQAYSSALERLSAASPADVEIGSSYALSLISLAELEDVDSIANLKKAIAILDPLLQQYPDHPGVAHYLIHATDRPEFAEQGLAAARRYAAIAPDSSHALHMPSHIFVRLGLWQDSISSNLAAQASGAHAAEMHHAESHYQTHAMDFLSYSYLQSGQEAKARDVIEQTDKVVGASDERSYLAARTAIELHRWKEAADLPIRQIREIWLDTTYWAKAIGAARSGDVKSAEADVRELSRLVDERRKRSRKSGYLVSTEKAIDLQEAEAWLALAQGKSEEAIAELRAAADHEDKNGGNSVGVPAREMLADLLLELKRPTDALAEYKLSLKDSPNRFDGLWGAARASQALGDSSGAQRFYAKLSEICPPGADRPELGEVKTVLAQK